MINTILLFFILFPIPCTGFEPPDPPTPPMPAVADMPLVLTNYWPYIEVDGNLVLMEAWNGQCNEDCGEFANGVINRVEWIGKSAGCWDNWIGRHPHNTATVNIPGYGFFVCNDAFGDEDYRQPRYYEQYGIWGIPIDLMVPYVLGSVVVYDYSLGSRLVSQEPPNG